MPGNSSYRIHRASIIFCAAAYVVVPTVVYLSWVRSVRKAFGR